MIEIRTLTQLSLTDLTRLSSGYTSPASYRVTKQESHSSTRIALELVRMDQPYVKCWPVLDEDLQRYQGFLPQELSLGAYEGDLLVGLILGERNEWNRTLWVWELGVAGTHRRLGIGRQLVGTLAERGRAAGLRIMTCETQSTNVPAITFYRQAGFVLDGIDLSYYSNNDAVEGEVAIFMKRRL